MESSIVINTPEKYTFSIPVTPPSQPIFEIPKIQRAAEAVCTAFGMNYHVLKTNPSRKREFCVCRQAVWKIIREDDLMITLKSLAGFFGKFDHTTVLFGVNSITGAMLTDEGLVKKYEMAVELYNSSVTTYQEDNYYDYADKL